MRDRFRPRFHPQRGGHGGGGGGGGGKPHRAPDQTLQEIHYLKQLIERQTPICVKLRNNEEVRGVIEYYDQSFIRVTRNKAPNLFIFKHEIKYLYEERSGHQSERRSGPSAPDS